MHLDPEWLAFEVFADGGKSEEESDQDDSDGESESNEGNIDTIEHQEDEDGSQHPQDAYVDLHLAEQMHNMSVAGTQSSTLEGSTASPGAEAGTGTGTISPFGAVTTSLSLLEMLVRLASLQEFQQLSHLAIPDHILTFFLEETSTTGLRGEARWKVKQAAKQRMGFDPFTDTPTKRV